ncbi:hypothetical protein [Flavobacterium gawalongense]|uniref:Uncharacterized protein n=1 Tax=Flavobacterium gawalongense TaxID=2594432 RepID=A0ABY3CRD0_9FLAO|nr:hypothetical protein [Flavobacterium gawalongense]TRX03755.1 hypothetical protein FNW33_03580 [Flavobacterium gawalongense]TRX08902.1 hypothetical protein FNW12_03720 [Flavobacterium gawalongense]
MKEFSVLLILLIIFSCNSSSGVHPADTCVGTTATEPVIPVVKLSDVELIDVVQKQIFAYFWN